jgi:transposase
MGVGLSRRICQRWVTSYNEEGLAGLEDRRGQESRWPLSAEQEEVLRARIEAESTKGDWVCSP